MPTKKSKSLIQILDEFNPRQMANGQIRMQCPFKENHTDGSGEYSFFVTPDINAYHCFSCRAHGSVTRLLNKEFGVNYFEAITMVNFNEVEKRAEFELDIHWDIKPPREFLKRGFTADTLRKFKLGVGSDGWTIMPFMLDGELKGYQRRIDKPDRVVMNSKGFNKQSYLYNLDHSYDYVIVVEGYSDVIRLFQHGYNSTAVLGADVSKWQAEEISKFKHVYSAFDNDEAGRRATELLYHQIKNHTDVKIIPYVTKDPGECKIKSEWVDAFENATSYLEYSMEMSMYQEDYLDMKEEVILDLLERSKKK